MIRRCALGGPVSQSGPSPEEAELKAAAEELEAALDALRRARELWPGERPWIGAKTWDVGASGRAIGEAEGRLAAARERLDRAVRAARDRRMKKGSQA